MWCGLFALVRSHEERRCSNPGPTQSSISPSILEYTKVDFSWRSFFRTIEEEPGFSRTELPTNPHGPPIPIASRLPCRIKSAARRDNSREWGRLTAKVEPLLTLGNSGNRLITFFYIYLLSAEDPTRSQGGSKNLDWSIWSIREGWSRNSYSQERWRGRFHIETLTIYKLSSSKFATQNDLC